VQTPAPPTEEIALSTHRPAAQAEDILLPMPPQSAHHPNLGACWRSEAIRELARQDATSQVPPLNHTASAALLGDARDTAPNSSRGDMPDSPRAAYEMGHDMGLRHGWRTGVAWGMLCGIVATVGLVSALVVVFAAIDAAPESQRITLQGPVA